MLKKKGVVVAAVALMFLFLASPVFANDDHYVLSAECNGVTLSKAVLYSGYNPPNGEWVTSDPMTGLELNTHYEWWIRIQICTEKTINCVRLDDRLGAEFGVEVIDFTEVSTGEEPVLTTKGNSDKVFLNWNIGTLCGEECATVWLHVWTDCNPHGWQEFTSYGCYYMNSGAVAKWKDCGVQYSAVTGQIVISTIPSPS